MKKVSTCLLSFFLSLFVWGQNVGIGTTTPNRLLHVSGSGEVLRVQGSFPWIGFMNNTDATYNGFLFYPDTSLVMGSRFGSNQPLILAPNNEGLLFATATQRVGIGAPAPTEKLDVNGNINVTGTIKANGVDGTANQVLMKNSSGTMVWGDMCEFKNSATFLFGNASWDIPIGTKRLWVELWGGGASGITEVGGGGGGYLSAIIDVINPSSPGAIFYQVGTGGFGGFAGSPNLAGTASVVSYTNPTGLTLTAQGAQPPTVSGSVVTGGNQANYFVSPASFTNYLGRYGRHGEAYRSEIFSSGGTNYERVFMGNGGNAGNTEYTGGQAGQMLLNLTTNAVIRRVSSGNTGFIPGGGGSSGGSAINGGIISLSGSSGANGMIVIHY